MADKLCPNCGTELEPYAEVDIGVGVMQGGPWGCSKCHYVEEEPTLPSAVNEAEDDYE